jgi:hypothetical protein
MEQRTMRKQLAETILLVALMAWCSASHAQQILVIRGGTLIDGNGGAPVADASIVIEGDRIKEVRAGGLGSVPAGAKVIDAKGKFVIPGLQDFHVHFREWMSPLFINEGVTTMHDIGNNPPDWILAQREMFQKEIIPGPRLYSAILNLWGKPNWVITGGMTMASAITFETVDEARKWAQKAVELKADYIKVHEGFTGEMLVAVAQVSKQSGLPMVGHVPPSMDAFQAAERGQRHFEHSLGIGRAISRNLEETLRLKEEVQKDIEGKTRNSFEDQLIEFYSVDPAKEDKLIKLLIEKNDFVEPNWIANFRNLTPRRKEWVSEDAEFLSRPELAFVPRDARFRWLDYTAMNYFSEDMKANLRKSADNFQKFVVKFVKAGGKINVGTAAPDVIAGVGVHREMQLMTDAGVPPMKALQAATRNIADLAGKLKDLGTLEPGKYADMLILDADPLADISATRKIAYVIKGGKIMDRKYSADFKNPIPTIAMTDETTHNSPQPTLAGVEPVVFTTRNEASVLHVKGTGFIISSVVHVNQTPVKTTFVSPGLLEATLPKEMMAQVGTYSVRVINPEPLPPLENAGRSNKVMFIVKFK